MSLYLTRRALLDIRKLHAQSIEKHGTLTADNYLEKIELSLNTIEAHPDLLRERGFTDHLRLYFSGKHVLFCATIEKDIYVTAVFHGSMDIEKKVPELEQGLLGEAQIMHRKLKKAIKE